MDMLSLIIVLGVAFLVSLWISRPFNSSPAIHSQPEAEQNAGQTSLPRRTLQAEHQRLLDALQELEIDHDQGKLPDADYDQQRAHLMQAGAGVLRALDNSQLPHE